MSSLFATVVVGDDNDDDDVDVVACALFCMCVCVCVGSLFFGFVIHPQLPMVGPSANMETLQRLLSNHAHQDVRVGP